MFRALYRPSRLFAISRPRCYVRPSVKVFCTEEGDDYGNSLKQMNVMLTQRARDGDLDGALKIFNAIEADGFDVPRTSYHTIISACIRDRDYNLSRQLIDSMISKGVHPNTRTYNIFLNLSIKCRKIDESFTYHEDMKRSGLLPDKVTFEALIAASLHRRYIHRLLIFYKDMRKYYTPSIEIYQRLVRYFVSTNDHARIFYILDDMKKAKVEPNQNIRDMVFPISDILEEEERI